MKPKELFIIPTWVFILLVVALAVSIGMNCFQAHVINKQFEYLEQDVSLFRENMILLDSVESRYSRLFDKAIEYKDEQITKAVTESKANTYCFTHK